MENSMLKGLVNHGLRGTEQSIRHQTDTWWRLVGRKALQHKGVFLYRLRLLATRRAESANGGHFGNRDYNTKVVSLGRLKRVTCKCFTGAHVTLSWVLDSLLSEFPQFISVAICSIEKTAKKKTVQAEQQGNIETQLLYTIVLPWRLIYNLRSWFV